MLSQEVNPPPPLNPCPSVKLNSVSTQQGHSMKGDGHAGATANHRGGTSLVIPGTYKKTSSGANVS